MRAAHPRSRPFLENAVPDTSPVITLSPRDYDAILFDLDGVLTQTARVHAAAWKRLFDQLLEQQSVETGESFVPFDIDDDYRRHVDGKPRQDGVVVTWHRRLEPRWSWMVRASTSSGGLSKIRDTSPRS